MIILHLLCNKTSHSQVLFLLVSVFRALEKKFMEAKTIFVLQVSFILNTMLLNDRFLDFINAPEKLMLRYKWMHLNLLLLYKRNANLIF
jgi:hypothetical protein